ncbi:MAG: D-lysine 5,6-aminomutase subunit alpha, partial [Clostridiales bacterium]|nr:D-lysine 5,6-aminomutase subunit alpha [Clostridiales bacterium]
MSKLNLDFNLVDQARNSAKNIALSMQEFIDQHTTVTVERAVIRLYGVDGVDELDRPLPNIVVDKLKNNGKLS